MEEQLESVAVQCTGTRENSEQLGYLIGSRTVVESTWLVSLDYLNYVGLTELYEATRMRHNREDVA